MNNAVRPYFFAMAWSIAILYLMYWDTSQNPGLLLKTADYIISISVIGHALYLFGSAINTAMTKIPDYATTSLKKTIIGSSLLATINIIAAWLIYNDHTGKTLIGVSLGCLIPAASFNLILYSIRNKLHNKE
ncbi:hypothetical protein [Pseudomonas sp. LP_7_YM]|uniref:hypothetical protein n=1 Tax=Pseudomonas sp. LP_7_YM TaxID=2485137 RepID=UPI0010612EB6|nr:hypothetical protein [Pseudomonas sp. LP_7_YM]TDV59503.1 hypothetical protein EC915_1163 [Pseudomonas sp. LP_7_YM]